MEKRPLHSRAEKLGKADRFRQYKPVRHVVRTRKGGKLEVHYNAAGRKILRESPELLQAFRELRDLPKEKLVAKAKKGLDLGYAHIDYVYHRDLERHKKDPTHVFRITLSNGRVFAFKLTRPHGILSMRQDIKAAYRLKKEGKEALNYYLQFDLPGTTRYFALMDYSKLPNADGLLSDLEKRMEKGPGKEEARRLHKVLYGEIQATCVELEKKGFMDVEAHNIFVRMLEGGKFELVHFDTGYQSHVR